MYKLNYLSIIWTDRKELNLLANLDLLLKREKNDPFLTKRKVTVKNGQWKIDDNAEQNA